MFLKKKKKKLALGRDSLFLIYDEIIQYSVVL